MMRDNHLLTQGVPAFAGCELNKIFRFSRYVCLLKMDTEILLLDFVLLLNGKILFNLAFFVTNGATSVCHLSP